MKIVRRDQSCKLNSLVTCLLKKKLPQANIFTNSIFPREGGFYKSCIMAPKFNEQLKYLCSREKLFMFLESQNNWVRRSGDLNKTISAEINYTFLNLSKGNFL